MKILRFISIFIIGLVIGWGAATTVSAHRQMERFKSMIPPEIQTLVAKSEDFMKGLSKDEMEQLCLDIREYNKHAVKESQIQSIWQAILAIKIQTALQSADTNRVNEVIEATLNNLKTDHAEGRFKGTEWENAVAAMVTRMNGTNLPPISSDSAEPTLSSER